MMTQEQAEVETVGFVNESLRAQLRAAEAELAEARVKIAELMNALSAAAPPAPAVSVADAVAPASDELMGALAVLFSAYCKERDGGQKFVVDIQSTFGWLSPPHDIVPAWNTVYEAIRARGQGGAM